MNFWEAQIEACTALSLVGYHFGMQDRIPIFKMYTLLRRIEGDRVEEARRALAELTEIRISGEEPVHDGVRYIE